MENKVDYFAQKQPKLIVNLGVPQPIAAKIVADIIAKNGGDSFSNRDEIDERYKEVQRTLVFTDLSFLEVQAEIEHIRIANPDEGTSIHTEDNNSFIGNTTWSDQMEMFWEYPTYTPQGAKIAAERKAEQDAKGILASWE